MAQPYVGEIRIFAGNFAPSGWALCDGALLAISEYDTLFNLIGTTYGGDGQDTFALPDLRSRVPVNMSTNNIGERSGVETVTLTTNQLPTHTHYVAAASVGVSNSPTSNFWAASPSIKQFGNSGAASIMGSGSLQATGGSQPHENRIPYLAVNYIISFFGIFPSPT